MRVIDGDELRERWLYDTVGNNPEFTPNDILDSIDEAPTVDAVPVIRCRRCKYAEPCPGAPLAFRCRISGRTTTHDFYCAEGVKKED